MVNRAVLGHLQSLLPICFIVFVCSEANADDKTEYLAELLQQSTVATREIPYNGTFYYQHFTEETKWEASFSIVQASSTARRIELLTPEHIKGASILRTAEAIWVSPLEEDRKERFIRETEHIPWDRIFRKGQGLEIEDIDLLVKNYTIEKTGNPIIIGRKTIKLEIRSKIEKWPRPSLNVWIDPITKLQLKYNRISPDKILMNGIVFKQISVGKDVSPVDFSTDGLEKIIDLTESRDPKKDIQLDFSPYTPTFLPTGFVKRFEDKWQPHRERWPGEITLHSSYSDGLSWLSIFQRRLNEKEKKKAVAENENRVQRLDRRGHAVYFIIINGLRISAVSDLHPRVTVRTLKSMVPARNSSSKNK